MSSGISIFASMEILTDLNLNMNGENQVVNFSGEIRRVLPNRVDKLVVEVAAWNGAGDDLMQHAYRGAIVQLRADWLKSGMYNNQPTLALHASRILSVTPKPSDDTLEPTWFQAVITGNVATDVRVGNAKGNPVSNFNLAINRSRDADRQTEFFRLAAWNKLQPVAANYVRLGAQLEVLLDWLTVGTWENKPTLTADAQAIILLGRGDGSANSTTTASASAPDDIPF